METQIFDNPEFGKIRTIEENGAVLFCGSDVARALGYAHPSNAIATHAHKAVKRRLTDSMGREHEMLERQDTHRGQETRCTGPDLTRLAQAAYKAILRDLDEQNGKEMGPSDPEE